MKRLLIADDHDAVRSGLRTVLEQRSDWKVVAEADNGRSAISAAMETRPHVAVVDYLMSDITGLEVARYIRSHLPETEVLIFTAHESALLAEQALQFGAGVLLKSEANKLLIKAVESLLDHTPFPINQGVFDRFGVKVDGEGRRVSVLSLREQQVAKLIADDHDSRSIGEVLGISPKTIETHRANLMRKLKVSSVAQVVRFAIRANLVDP